MVKNPQRRISRVGNAWRKTFESYCGSGTWEKKALHRARRAANGKRKAAGRNDQWGNERKKLRHRLRRAGGAPRDIRQRTATEGSAIPDIRRSEATHGDVLWQVRWQPPVSAGGELAVPDGAGEDAAGWSYLPRPAGEGRGEGERPRGLSGYVCHRTPLPLSLTIAPVRWERGGRRPRWCLGRWLGATHGFTGDWGVALGRMWEGGRATMDRGVLWLESSSGMPSS